MNLQEASVVFLVYFGVFFMLVAAIGLNRMPDVYLRMHGATKSTTLGITAILLAVALHFGTAPAYTRAALVVLFFLLTAPIGTQVLARAAYFSQVPRWEGTDPDELAEHYNVEASARAFDEIANVVLKEAVHLLGNNAATRAGRERLWAAQTAIKEARISLAQVHLDEHLPYRGRLALLHASDHLDRLVETCLEHEEPLVGEQVKAAAAKLVPEVTAAANWLFKPSYPGEDAARQLAEASARQADERRRHRTWLLAETAAGRVSPNEMQRQLESMRWVDRIGYHTWRALHHLAGTDSAAIMELFAEPAA
jgi:multicomponent Na+:H+ antiporter subunit G